MEVGGGGGGRAMAEVDGRRTVQRHPGVRSGG